MEDRSRQSVEMLSDELRFWTITTTAMKAIPLLRDTFVKALADLVRNFDIESYSQAEQILKSVMLMEVHWPSLQTLWREIEMKSYL